MCLLFLTDAAGMNGWFFKRSNMLSIKMLDELHNEGCDSVKEEFLFEVECFSTCTCISVKIEQERLGELPCKLRMLYILRALKYVKRYRTMSVKSQSDYMSRALK